jgi:hypothetical protein
MFLITLYLDDLTNSAIWTINLWSELFSLLMFFLLGVVVILTILKFLK